MVGTSFSSVSTSGTSFRSLLCGSLLVVALVQCGHHARGGECVVLCSCTSCSVGRSGTGLTMGRLAFCSPFLFPFFSSGSSCCSPAPLAASELMRFSETLCGGLTGVTMRTPGLCELSFPACQKGGPAYVAGLPSCPIQTPRLCESAPFVHHLQCGKCSFRPGVLAH